MGLTQYRPAYTLRVDAGTPDTPDETPAQRLGRYIGNRREQLQLTKTALASAAHVNPQTISALENGKQGPPRKSTTIRLEKELALRNGAFTHILAGGDPSEFEEDIPPAPEITYDIENLARSIRNRRTQLGLTQPELSARSNINAITISNLENARQGPPREGTAQRLERELRWKPGAITHILAGGDPADYTDDPPTEAEITIQLARSIITAVTDLEKELPSRPALAPTLITMLKSAEDNLTQLVAQNFTHEALQVLMQINQIQQKLKADIGE